MMQGDQLWESALLAVTEELKTSEDEMIVLVKSSEMFILNLICLWQLVFFYLLVVQLNLIENEYGNA